MSLQPGGHVAVIKGTYKGDTGVVQRLTASMAYVQTLAHAKEVRILQTSCSVVTAPRGGGTAAALAQPPTRRGASAVSPAAAWGCAGPQLATCKISDAVSRAARILRAAAADPEEAEFVERVRAEDYTSAEELVRARKPTLRAVLPASCTKGAGAGAGAGAASKVVFFSTYMDVLDKAQGMLAEALPHEEQLRIDGTVTGEDRRAAVEAFSSDRSHRVLFAGTNSGGVGLNLQSANVVFLLDPKWSPALERQAQDRVWRLGSPHAAVYFYRYCTRGTVDGTFSRVKDEKARLTEETVGQIEDCAPSLQLGASSTSSSSSSAGCMPPPPMTTTATTTAAAATTTTPTTRAAETADRAALATELAAAGFVADLHPHQSTGVRWMQRQERGENPNAPGVCGGILADDMGLGKTAQCLATISLDCRRTFAATGRWGKPTLVVCPKSVFVSWQHDAAKFATELRVHVWHDASRKGSQWPAARLQAEAAEHPLVVLTNYEALRAKAPLQDVEWRRVVLDESQAINNKKNGFEQACTLASMPRAAHTRARARTRTCTHTHMPVVKCRSGDWFFGGCGGRGCGRCLAPQRAWAPRRKGRGEGGLGKPMGTSLMHICMP